MRTQAGHLANLTENPASLPVALAQAIAGAQAWQGMGLLSGSSITDIVTALTSVCSQYGPDSRVLVALLRQEVPGQTDGDIEWLCGLTEEMEQFEPQRVVGPPLRPKSNTYVYKGKAVG